VFLFLNPDTEVKDRAIERTYSHFQDLPQAGCVGCRLLNSDGSLQTSCVQSLPTITNQVLDAEVLRRRFPNSSLWGIEALYADKHEAAEVEAVSGACLMIGRQAFEKAGGFSTDYFMYGEDLDLCFKSRQAGFKNYYVDEATIVHHGGGSSNQKRSDFSIVMMRESVKRFLRKSRGAPYSIGYQAALGLAAIFRMAVILALAPFYLICGRANGWFASFAKWLAVIRWSFGIEKWTREYDKINFKSNSPEGNKATSCAGSAEN
jgi:GT2 family glycosyltransferase